MKTYYVDSNGVKLRVLAQDEVNNQETILFIHGYPDDSSSFTKQYSHFKTNYRIAALDLRGVRNSFQENLPQSYKISELLEDIETVILFLVGANRKVHLVGHDWGAVLSWCFISEKKYQNLVYSFTAISCPHPRLMYDNFARRIVSFDFLEIVTSLEQFRKSWYIFLFQIPKLPEIVWNLIPEYIWKILMKASNISDRDEMYHYDKEKILNMVLGNINLYREILSGFNIPDLPFEKVNLPITVIIPEKDIMLHPMIYDRTNEYFPNIEEHRLQANHWVHREQADTVNRIIGSFLETYIKNSDIYYQIEWDATRLNSGEILIQLKNHFARMSSGQILKLISNEKDLKDPLQSWAHLTGNKILKFSEKEIYIKKK
jgi:pimeloyl-ACP methyl ester carboxylesterase/TusA-related sulfurtransferase